MNWYQRWKLRANPYEWAVILGMVATLLVYIEQLIQTHYSSISSLNQITGSIIIQWAFSEEISKLVAIILVLFAINGKRERIIYYSILVGLGFGLAETLIYVIGPVSQVPSIILNRAFVGVPLHIATTGFIGLMWYVGSGRIGVLLVLMSLVVSSAIHASFNYFIGNSGLAGWMGVINLLFFIALVIFYCVCIFIKWLRPKFQ